MIHVILFRPEIPQNTGNVGRLCACTSTRLHLIRPLGFSLSDRYLKRSGMDYWQYLDVREHINFEAFLSDPDHPKRIWLLTTHAQRRYTEVSFRDGDGILFGNEGSGCPDCVHKRFENFRITIPMIHPKVRSLNLATAVGIVRYEILRQCRC